MKNKKPMNINCTRTIYFDVARMYAKKSCKHCHGKGYLKYITPEGEDNYNYCNCAEKNIKKYG